MASRALGGWRHIHSTERNPRSPYGSAARRDLEDPAMKANLQIAVSIDVAACLRAVALIVFMLI